MPSVTDYCRRGRIPARRQPGAAGEVPLLPLPIQLRMGTIQRSTRIRSLTSRLPGRDEAGVVVTAIQQRRREPGEVGVAQRAVGAQVQAARRDRQLQ